MGKRPASALWRVLALAEKEVAKIPRAWRDDRVVREVEALKARTTSRKTRPQ